MKNLYISFFSLFLLILAGCASERKARQLEREKISQATGLFCEFVNGDQYRDVDVQTNFHMSKKCDPTKPFSVTGYRNSSEMYGVIYCCNILSKVVPAAGNLSNTSTTTPVPSSPQTTTVPSSNSSSE